jgi:hypothetical protein
LPTKQPPRLREVVINRITNAIFFMEAPRMDDYQVDATKSWLIKGKREPGAKRAGSGRARLEAKRLQDVASVFDGAAVFRGLA